MSYSFLNHVSAIRKNYLSDHRAFVRQHLSRPTAYSIGVEKNTPATDYNLTPEVLTWATEFWLLTASKLATEGAIDPTIINHPRLITSLIAITSQPLPAYFTPDALKETHNHYIPALITEDSDLDGFQVQILIHEYLAALETYFFGFPYACYTHLLRAVPVDLKSTLAQKILNDLDSAPAHPTIAPVLSTYRNRIAAYLTPHTS